MGLHLSQLSAPSSVEVGLISLKESAIPCRFFVSVESHENINMGSLDNC